MAELGDIAGLLAGALCAGPVHEERIRSAEAALGVHFPKSYKAFLAQYGAAGCSGFDIAGIFQNDNPDEPPQWSDVVTTTILLRQASRGLIPHAYIPISDDGTDYTFYLDTSRLSSENECPVVVLGPGADDVIVAEDFVDFVLRASTGTLNF